MELEKRIELLEKEFENMRNQIEVLENSFLEIANVCGDDNVTGNEVIVGLQKAGLKINQGAGFKWKN